MVPSLAPAAVNDVTMRKDPLSDGVDVVCKMSFDGITEKVTVSCENVWLHKVECSQIASYLCRMEALLCVVISAMTFVVSDRPKVQAASEKGSGDETEPHLAVILCGWGRPPHEILLELSPVMT